MEMMRDLAYIWTRTAQKGRAMAWKLLEGVCEDMELRHEREVFDELTTKCEEVSEEYMTEFGLLDRLMKVDKVIWPDMNPNPYTLAGYLISGHCIKSADVCSREEVDPQILKFPKEPQRMITSGLGIGLMNAEQLKKYLEMEHGDSTIAPPQAAADAKRDL